MHLPLAHRFILLFLLFGHTMVCKGQTLFALQALDDTVTFRVSAQMQRLNLQWITAPVTWKKKNNFPNIESVALEDGDLFVRYRAPKFKPDIQYTFDATIESGSGRHLRPRPQSVHDNEEASSKNTRIWVWEDVTPDLLEVGAVYNLTVRRSLMGAVNCDEVRPAFTTYKQLVHYAAGVVGLGLVGIGQAYNTQKKNEYDTYQNLWREGISRELAQPYYENAQDKDELARICTYTGLAILGIDAAWYGLRWMKIKNRQQIYDEFCNGLSLRATPWIRPDGNRMAGGLYFGLTF